MALAQTTKIKLPKKPADKKITTAVKPNVEQPAKRTLAADKKLAPADIKPADVPKAKQVARGTKIANSNLSGAVARTDTPPAKTPRKQRASSTTKITRGVSDVSEQIVPNDSKDTRAENEHLASIEEARAYYLDLLGVMAKMFKPIAIPGEDIDSETGVIREDSATEKMNRLVVKVRSLVFHQIRKYIDEGLEICSRGSSSKTPSLMSDLLLKVETAQTVSHILTQNNFFSFSSPTPLHHVREENIRLPGFSQETRTLFSGIRAVLVARTASEGDYSVLARNVESLKQAHPALTVWIEYRLKRVLVGKPTREEVAIALIDTLLSLGNVSICSTSSGKFEGDRERISYLAVWCEVEDPGVMHYARLSSDNQTTFALTGQKNVERFTHNERTMLLAMIASTDKNYPWTMGAV